MKRSSLLLCWTAVAALIAACADAPTAPSSGALTPGAAFSGGKSDAEKAAEKAAKEAEKAAEKAAKEQEAAARRLAKDEFEALKKEWDRYKKAVEKGNAVATGLRCEPTKSETRTKRIGVKGGTIEVGLHTIEIPEGALTGDVEISASVQAGRSLELDFAPHGLQFRKPVEITFDYAHCVVEDAQALNVLYVGTGWRILETMPSTDKRGTRRISALTDHFSGYMVSTGRSMASEEDAGF